MLTPIAIGLIIGRTASTSGSPRDDSDSAPAQTRSSHRERSSRGDAVVSGIAKTDLDVPLLTSALKDTMYGEGDRAAARDWMAKHPDSPFVPYLEEITQAEP